MTATISLDAKQSPSLGTAIINAFKGYADKGIGEKPDMATSKAIVAEARTLSDADRAWYTKELAAIGQTYAA